MPPRQIPGYQYDDATGRYFRITNDNSNERFNSSSIKKAEREKQEKEQLKKDIKEKRNDANEAIIKDSVEAAERDYRLEKVRKLLRSSDAPSIRRVINLIELTKFRSQNKRNIDLDLLMMKAQIHRLQKHFEIKFDCNLQSNPITQFLKTDSGFLIYTGKNIQEERTARALFLDFFDYMDSLTPNGYSLTSLIVDIYSLSLVSQWGLDPNSRYGWEMLDAVFSYQDTLHIFRYQDQFQGLDALEVNKLRIDSKQQHFGEDRMDEDDIHLQFSEQATVASDGTKTKTVVFSAHDEVLQSSTKVPLNINVCIKNLKQLDFSTFLRFQENQTDYLLLGIVVPQTPRNPAKLDIYLHNISLANCGFVNIEKRRMKFEELNTSIDLPHPRSPRKRSTDEAHPIITLNSKVSTFDMIQYEGKKLLSFGSYQSNSVFMADLTALLQGKQEIKEYSKFGTGVTQLKFIERDDGLYLLVAGIKNILKLYCISPSTMKMDLLVNYEGFEQNPSLKYSFKVVKDFIAISSGNFIKFYYLFSPNALKRPFDGKTGKEMEPIIYCSIDNDKKGPFFELMVEDSELFNGEIFSKVTLVDFSDKDHMVVYSGLMDRDCLHSTA